MAGLVHLGRFCIKEPINKNRKTYSTLTRCTNCKFVGSGQRVAAYLPLSLATLNPLTSTTTKEAIFHHLNYSQQKRGYAPKNHRNCWNCKREDISDDTELLCQHCGFLHDVKTDINYFDLFKFPQNFDLDAQVLTKRFRQLQTVVHPDKFSNKSSREQSNSADWSSLVNKAYKTLSIPLKRGQYLLELKGVRIPQDNSALDKEFLMEMMERNEEVEGASTRNELISINECLAQELKRKIQSLAKTFSENNLEVAKTLLIEMKYLISIQKTIKNKLQTLSN